MPNVSVNLSGAGIVVGDAQFTGRVTGAGFTSSANGTAGTPAYNFTSEPDCGLYYTGTANRIALVSNATDIVRVDSFGPSLIGNKSFTGGTVAVDGNMTMGTGRKLILDDSTSTADLALQFNGDPNLGLYRSSADNMDFVAAGGGIARAQGSALTILGNAIFANAAGFDESSAPGATANRSWVYALDVGGKTQLTSKNGGAGTVVALAIEV